MHVEQTSKAHFKLVFASTSENFLTADVFICFSSNQELHGDFCRISDYLAIKHNLSGDGCLLFPKRKLMLIKKFFVDIL